MDATRTHLNRIAFIFLTLALAIAAPWSAQAQPAFTQSNYQVTLSSTGSSVNIAGTADSSSPSNPITFTASSIAYSSNSFVNGVPRPWLQVGSDRTCAGTSSIGYQTPVTIPLNVGCYGQSGGLSTGTYQAQVTLTPTSSAIAQAFITVTFTIGSGSGSNGGITASPSSVTWSAPVGSSTSTTLTLSTNNTTSITYSTSAQPASWLSVAPTLGLVSANSPATLYLYFNAGAVTSATTLQTTIYINYNTTSLPVTVTFYVGGGGSGALVLSPSTVSWNYATGSSLPSSSLVNIFYSSAPYYGLTFSGSPLFLSVNGYTGSTGNTTFPFATYGTTLTLVPNSAVIPTLATGTYYNYITVTESNGQSATLTATLTVNSSSSNSNGILTISPDPIQLNGVYLGSTVSAPITVTSTLSGTLALAVSGQNLSISSSASIASSQTLNMSISANQPITLYVIGAPITTSGSLGVGTYGGSVTATVNGSNELQIPTTFTISNNGGGTGTSGATVAPSTFQFNFEQGTTTLEPQSLSINGTTGGSDTYSISNPSASWLEIGPSVGPAPAIVALYVVGPNSLPVGTSSAYFTVTTTIGGYTTSVQVTVNIQITASGVPVLVAQTSNGGSINLQYTGGSANPGAQSLYLSASDGSAQTFTATASASWITLSATTGTTPASLSASLNVSALPNGVNSGYITITGNFGTATVPVEVYVTASTTSSTGVLTLSRSSLSFDAVYASNAPSSQTLTVSTTTPTSFSASASGTSGGVTWLTISPSGSLSTNQTLTVSVNQSGLPLGTYSGYISLATTSGTQTVPVTLYVTVTSTTALTISPASLSFSFTTGGSTPGAQTVTVTSGGSSPVTFTLAESVTSGSGWLVLTTTAGNAIASGTNETTGFSFLAYANPTGLAAGTYVASITVTPAGGSTLSIPVTLTVTGGSTVSATPSSLNFSYQVGGSNPAAQSISAAGASGAALAFTATATSTGNWLTVTPTSGNTPATLAVTVAPSSLTAGAYTGTIVVAGSGSAGGSTTITVTLTVTAPLPTITAVVNGASFAGGKIAPGEIVTIGGSNLGPVNGLGLTLTSTGTVSTSLGNVSVSFNGYAAPLIYVSQTQINCVVPYEVAALVNPFVQVTYAGQASNAYSLSAGATAPGIFTQNGQGSGPGAVLNTSGTVNGPGSPAAKGSAIVIYMTGEGQTSPAGVTGSVTAVNTSSKGPLTPQPLLLVAVTIGGQPATVQFYGEAPGLVAGVMQVNVIVPAAASSGVPNALVVSVGGNPSQTGVTVAVQ
ncbi:MAG: BACON domain-containing protein [Bryobacteraceae bacterium]|jgi:uncharacterized protein (TIGR03437 family)